MSLAITILTVGFTVIVLMNVGTILLVRRFLRRYDAASVMHEHQHQYLTEEQERWLDRA